MICQLCSALMDFNFITFGFDQVVDMRFHARKHFIQLALIGPSPDPEEILRKCFPQIKANEAGGNGLQESEIKSMVGQSSSTTSASTKGQNSHIIYGVKNSNSNVSKDQSSATNQSKGNRHQGKMTKQRICRRLIEKFARDFRIDCRKCSKRLCARESDPMNMVYHASKHLAKILYNCRYCSGAFTNYWTAKGHIQDRHQLSAIGGYIDHSHKYEDEIKAELIDCYGELTDDDEQVEDDHVHEDKSHESVLIFCNSPRVKDNGHTVPKKAINLGNGNRSKPKISTIVDRGYDQVATVYGIKFACTKCPFKTRNENLMRGHCNHFHRVE